MSVSFVKLFTTITDSSVWDLPDGVRVIWITLLAMANSRGNVHAAIPGVANRARKTIAEVEEALRIFSAPDPYSRTKDHEGRRIAEIDGGWCILNYAKHRRAIVAETSRESKRAYAERVRREAETDDSSAEVEFSRNESNSCSVSLSGSDLDLDPDLTRARANPTPAQGVPQVWFTLDGWEMSDELRAEAVIAGVPAADIDQRIKELKNGPIGGRRGVINRDDYVRAQFPKWRTWAETERAKAHSGAGKGPSSGFARSPQNPSGWAPSDKHEALARKLNMAPGDLQRLAAAYVRAGAAADRSVQDADIDFAKRLVLRSKGKPFGCGVAA